ncbi:MAG: hypothetical protein ABH878_08620 [bacterium]
MAFEQAYYTSCEVGLRGTKGFQMNAVSPGLDSSLHAFLERYGVYVPPISAPTAPTPEELAGFPKTLAFYKTPDGKAVLSRSVYLGKDYSGRYGNFFTHFIVSPDCQSLLDVVTPILTWEADFWTTQTVAETEIPPISALAPAKQVSLKSVQDLIVSDANRKNHLRTFVSAAHEALKSKKRMIIVDDSENVANWIALAALALPQSLVAELTFSTYIKNPYNTDVLLCGTSADSDFGFSQAEVQHQFFVFDFVQSRFSPAAPETKWSVKLTSWFEEGKLDDIHQFKAFADNLNVSVTASELDTLLTLYLFVEKVPISPAEIIESVNFLIRKKLVGNENLLISTTAALWDGFDLQNRAADEVVESLYVSAASAADIPSSIVNDVTHFFADWVVQRILPFAPTSTVRRIQATLVKYPIASLQWSDSLNALHRQLKTSNDLKWITMVFEFAEVVGILTLLEASFVSIAKQLLISNLSETEAQDLLARLFETEKLPEIDQAVFSLLAEVSKDPRKLDAASSFLSQPKTYARLDRYAKEKREKPLILILSALRIAHESEKGESTAEFIEQVNKDTGVHLEAKDLDVLFQLGWRNCQTISRDALFLIKKLPNVMDNAAFIDCIARGLSLSPDILSPRSETSELLSKLKQHFHLDTPPIKLPSKSTPIPVALKECFELTTLKSRYDALKTLAERTELIEEAISKIPAGNARARRDLLKHSVYRFLTTSTSELTSKTFLTYLEGLDEQLLATSLSELLPEIVLSKTLSLPAWIQVFKFVQQRKAKPVRLSVAMDLVDQQLHKSYSALMRSQKQWIDEAMVKDTAFAPQWNRWKKGSSLLGTLMKKILPRN